VSLWNVVSLYALLRLFSSKSSCEYPLDPADKPRNDVIFCRRDTLALSVVPRLVRGIQGHEVTSRKLQLHWRWVYSRNIDAISLYSLCHEIRGLYLLETWHTSTRPPFIDFSDAVKWLGLSIKRCEQLNEQHAIVEFVARYKIHGRAYRLHEISRFLREHERWYYVDGDVL